MNVVPQLIRELYDGGEWAACRELAIASFTGKRKFKSVFPLVGRDFLKMMIGLGASVGIVLFIHYLVVPNGW